MAERKRRAGRSVKGVKAAEFLTEALTQRCI